MPNLAADCVVTNGNLITLDRERPRASAMAIRDGRIVAVGADAEMLRLAGDATEKLDLRGRTVTPGFCDSHLHLYWYGRQLLFHADLVGATSVADINERLAAVIPRSTGWVVGHGFDQDKLRERRFPTREDLDALSPARPIIISRVCGHAAVVNSAALAEVTRAQAAAGDPDSGLYTETAIDPFYAAIPPLSESEAEDAVLAAAKVALRTGITSVQTLLDTPDQMAAYARLHRKGKLPLRVMGTPPHSAAAQLHAHGINTGFGDEWLRFGGAKLFSDGSLGARTARLSEPYADDPSTQGIRIYDPATLKRLARDAQTKGFQILIHAIGDQALRESLDAIEFALDGQSNTLHRHRVEHASVCPPDCVERMAQLKIVATLQPQFVTSDTWTGQRLGPRRAPWAYPFRSFVNAGVPVSLSSDCPVERLDAFAALAAAVGRHPWSPAETLTPEQAIHAYCMGSAYAGHAESWSGSLAPGKVADFVLLSDDPAHLPATRIRDLRADEVWIAGRRASNPDL